MATPGVEAEPLLVYESLSSSNNANGSAASPSTQRGLRFSLSRHWSSSSNAASSSYTDLHSLAPPSAAAVAESGKPPVKKNELGTINGVYVPCLLNIIGVILFLRLGWGVGQAGVEGMLLIFVVAELQAVLTVLSACTIASNGAMRGGGSYYLISRSLGPEFGGAIGLQFYFLYAVGVAMYLVGFAEEAQQTWAPAPAIGKRTMVVLIATGALAAIVAIAFVGASAFARVNKYLFVLQFACVAIGALFIYVGKAHALASGGEYTGMSSATLSSNMHEQFTADQGVCGDGVVCTLAGVYAIVFPLATGFMEGLNLSGDLKNPGKSLPVGTLAAVGTSCVIYVVLILTFAAAFTGDALRTNFSFFQEASDYPVVVITGVLVSCFSSGLGALFGASRILQAIARDELFPGLRTLAQGSATGDEPRHAVVFTAVLAQVFICIGDLDVIAPICTSFFCLAYAAVNLTCLLLQVTGVPNFRPTFRFHAWPLALFGTILNLGVMIYLNATYAAVSLVVVAALIGYLTLTAAPTPWGDISQAIMYHQVRKFLLRLDTRRAHSKYWRPSLLLLTTDIASPDVQLCASLKKGGLYVIGSVVTGDFGLQSNAKCGDRYNKWLGHIFDTKLKAIPQVVVAAHARDGYRMLMQTSGLGGMQINTVVVPWLFSDATTLEAAKRRGALTDLASPSDYVGLVVDGIALQKNVVVLRHSERLDARLLRNHSSLSSVATSLLPHPTPDKLQLLDSDSHCSTETIDVWITSDSATTSVEATTTLMLQLAYVLYSNKAWRVRTKLRLLKVCGSTNPSVLQRERLRLAHTVERLRMTDYVSDLVVVSANASRILADTTSQLLEPPTRDYFADDSSVAELNQLLQRHTTRTAQIILMLPDPRVCVPALTTATAVAIGDAVAAAAVGDTAAAVDVLVGNAAGDRDALARAYVAKLELLTANLPSTMLVFNEDDSQVVSTSI